MFIIAKSTRGELPALKATTDRDESYEIFEQWVAETEHVGDSVVLGNLWCPTDTEIIPIETYVWS